jgi:hypothetical protein
LPAAAKRVKEIAAKLPSGSPLRARAERLAAEIEEQQARLTGDILSALG